jgi:NADP-dependent 3-hydroxy acid dehydrogenase YdfG
LGVNTDIVEYFMGHVQSTYMDIQMKGIEFLRNVYAASGISIRPKTQQNKIEVLKEMVRVWGMNPEEVLTKEALSRPFAATNFGEEEQAKSLSMALKEMMRKELLNGKQP